MTAAIEVEAAAAAILPILEEASPEAERNRSVAPEAIRAIQEAGLSRLMTPKRFGGAEAPASAHIQSCITLAHGCAAAAWVHMVCGAHTYVVGRFPEACQRDVFDASPDVLIPGALAPQGKAHRVDGGWRLSGRWQFGSGIDHGPWLLLGAVARQTSEGDPMGLNLVLPKARVEVLDTWRTLGMRGSGSQDIVAEDVFVPDSHAMPTLELFRGNFAVEAGQDMGALYRLPVMGGLATMLAGVLVGMTERGLERFTEAARTRIEVYSGRPKSGRVGLQMRLAEALGEAQLARMLVERNCELLDAAMLADDPPLSVDASAQIHWNAAHASEICRRAADRAYAAAGANAAFDDNPLQQWRRDIETATHHAICDFDGALEMRGRVALGLSPGAML